MSRRFWFTFFTVFLGWAGLARADGLQALEAFLRDVGSARAEFVQVVTSPPRAGELAPRRKTSSGRFLLLRPDRFRFEYIRPFVQTIVADGQNLWLYDADLNQVTVRPQRDALGSTPAALIASGGEMGVLRDAFVLQSQPEGQDGLVWVLAQPRQADGGLKAVRVGLRQGRIAVLEIEDGLGQRSEIRFSQWQSNPGLKPSDFRFEPPAGVDVVRP